MVNVCSTHMWLKPAIAALELSQMIVQGMWNEDSRLLQLPHFDKERSRGFESEGVNNIFDFMEMEDDVRASLLEGLTEKETGEIAMFCNDYPDIEVTPTLENASALPAGEDQVLHVKLGVGEEEEEEEYDVTVKSQQFPQKLRQTWWLILGDSEENTIQAITEVDLEKTREKKLVFTAPSHSGHYKWKLYLMTDGYVGCDQEYEIEFDVEGEAAEVMEEE